MSVKHELKTTRFIVMSDKSEKRWDELRSAEQRRLAYAWNSTAMAEAGYMEIPLRDARKVIAG